MRRDFHEGLPKTIRTFEAQIDSNPKATGDRVLQRKIEGMSVTIDLDRVERTESIVALKSILDELEH